MNDTTELWREHADKVRAILDKLDPIDRGEVTVAIIEAWHAGFSKGMEASEEIWRVK